MSEAQAFRLPVWKWVYADEYMDRVERMDEYLARNEAFYNLTDCYISVDTRKTP